MKLPNVIASAVVLAMGVSTMMACDVAGFSAKYQVFNNQKKAMVKDLSLAPSDQGYRISSSFPVKIVFVRKMIRQEATGLVDSASGSFSFKPLAMDSYFGDTKAQNIVFNQDKNQVAFYQKGKLEQSFALKDTMSDQLSMQLKLMRGAMAYQQNPQQNTLSLNALFLSRSGLDAQAWQFDFSKDTLDTALFGSVPVIKVSGTNQKNTGTWWFVPSKDFVLAQTKITDQKGDVIEEKLLSYSKDKTCVVS